MYVRITNHSTDIWLSVLGLRRYNPRKKSKEIIILYYNNIINNKGSFD